MKWGIASILLIGVFSFAALGMAASSFSDAAGDNNEAPDVTSVGVSQAAAATTTITVTVANHQTLPADSWFNLWFDLDSNASTGDDGDEALVRYFSDGTVEFFRWNGSELARQAPDGMTAAYSNGVLTFTAPTSALADATSFGILAVASRQQVVDDYIAADFAPDITLAHSAFVGPGPMSFADPSGDHPAAPDMTSVRVADAKNGTISFAITTPNIATLPPSALALLFVDRDGKQSTGAGGADILVLYQAGDVQIGRWNRVQQQFIADDPPSRVQVRNEGGVLTFLVHRSELGDPTRFGFSVGAAHMDESGMFDALDIAPESLFWRYTLSNKPALRLLVGKTIGAPTRPVAGKLFTVKVPVTRSDTGRPIATGSVTCSVRVGGAKVAASGRVASGGGRCVFRVPAASSGKRIAGSVMVRSGGKTVTVRFAFTVR